MSLKYHIDLQVVSLPLDIKSGLPAAPDRFVINKLTAVSTVDFHITTKCSQAFPRAMFSVKWEKLVITDDEFHSLAGQISTPEYIHVNYLDHKTLDKLYVMVTPDGSMIVPMGSDYLNYGPFLDVEDFDQALRDSQFDSAKHLRHSRGWGKKTQYEI